MTTSGAARDVSIEAILRVPLFADLNKHEIQEIARLLKEHRFAKGETIVQEGSTGDTLFLIESGEAGVFIGGRGRTTMKSPDYFGEVALIDEGTRIDDLRLQRNLGGLDHHINRIAPIRFEVGAGHEGWFHCPVEPRVVRSTGSGP